MGLLMPVEGAVLVDEEPVMGDRVRRGKELSLTYLRAFSWQMRQ